MDFIVYEDTPRTDVWMRAIIFLPSLIFLATAVIMPVEEPWVPVLMIIMALVIGALLYLLLPSRLSILDSAINIRFHLNLTFRIPFDTVVTLRPSRWSTVGINLPNNLSQSKAVEIVRRKRMTVTITPSDREAFIASFDKAIKAWKLSKERYR